MDVTTYDTAKLDLFTQNESSHPMRAGHCPTCGQETHFIFLGEQRWPEKVAAKLGLPAVMLQWSCQSCHTTLSEPAPDA